MGRIFRSIQVLSSKMLSVPEEAEQCLKTGMGASVAKFSQEVQWGAQRAHPAAAGCMSVHGVVCQSPSPPLQMPGAGRVLMGILVAARGWQHFGHWGSPKLDHVSHL